MPPDVDGQLDTVPHVAHSVEYVPAAAMMTSPQFIAWFGDAQGDPDVPGLASFPDGDINFVVRAVNGRSPLPPLAPPAPRGKAPAGTACSAAQKRRSATILNHLFSIGRLFHADRAIIENADHLIVLRTTKGCLRKLLPQPRQGTLSPASSVVHAVRRHHADTPHARLVLGVGVSSNDHYPAQDQQNSQPKPKPDHGCLIPIATMTFSRLPAVTVKQPLTLVALPWTSHSALLPSAGMPGRSVKPDPAV